MFCHFVSRAYFLHPRVSPDVRERFALLRFDGMNRTLGPLQEDAFTVLFFLQLEAAAVVG
jgi:hypothetical protein